MVQSIQTVIKSTVSRYLFGQICTLPKAFCVVEGCLARFLFFLKPFVSNYLRLDELILPVLLCLFRKATSRNLSFKKLSTSFQLPMIKDTASSSRVIGKQF